MKSVLITGASRGLGYELVKVFIQKGYFVYTVVREAHELDQLEKDFGNQCLNILGDLIAADIGEKVYEAINGHTKRLDLVINNAGLPGEACRIEDIKMEELLNVMQVNAFAPIKTVQGTLPFLKMAPQALVVNLSSRLGSLPKTSRGEFWNRQFSYAYRMSKAAQNMLTICMNQELSEWGIGVVGIHPGKLNTRASTTSADMTPEESANRIYDFIEHIKPEQYGKFIFPHVEELEW